MSRTIPGRVVQVRYLREGKYPGPYKHDFAERSNVRMLVRRGGREVALVSHRKIAADENAPGFSRYLHNPPRRRSVPRSSSSAFSFPAFVMFMLAATVANQLIGQRLGGGPGDGTT